MLLHPLFKTLATEPQLLLEHAAAYTDLASEEARQLLDHAQHRALWLGVTALLLLIGLTLVGGAMLVLAAVPYAALATPALLFIAPGLPLLGGLACWLRLKAVRSPGAFSLTRSQWALDRALVAQAEARA